MTLLTTIQGCPDSAYVALQCHNNAHSSVNRYHFNVSNVLGSVEDTVNLIVQDEDGQNKHSQKLNLESHSVTQDEYGDYVANSHAHNNNTFVLQFQV